MARGGLGGATQLPGSSSLHSPGPGWTRFGRIRRSPRGVSGAIVSSRLWERGQRLLTCSYSKRTAYNRDVITRGSPRSSGFLSSSK